MGTCVDSPHHFIKNLHYFSVCDFQISNCSVKVLPFLVVPMILIGLYILIPKNLNSGFQLMGQ